MTSPLPLEEIVAHCEKPRQGSGRCPPLTPRSRTMNRLRNVEEDA